MKTLEILDVCYPDYFSGYHRPVIAVPAFNNMTKKDLAEGIEAEVNATYEYLTEGHNCFTKTEILIIDEYINNLKADGDKIFIGNEFEDGDGDDSPFIYLSICKPVFNYGIKFLS